MGQAPIDLDIESVSDGNHQTFPWFSDIAKTAEGRRQDTLAPPARDGIDGLSIAYADFARSVADWYAKSYDAEEGPPRAKNPTQALARCLIACGVDHSNSRVARFGFLKGWRFVGTT